LENSPALSILGNPPASPAGRTLGVLLGSGADAKLLRMLKRACKAAKVTLKVVAPAISGIRDSDGATIEVDEKLGGGPSVLFDAVAVLGDSGAEKSLKPFNPAVKDFLNDAHAHYKFIAFDPAADSLLTAMGRAEHQRDGGYIALAGTKQSTESFIEQLGALRYWPREDHGE
jgi:catalase